MQLPSQGDFQNWDFCEELEATEIQDKTATQDVRLGCTLHSSHRCLYLQKKANFGKMEKWNNYFTLQQWARTKSCFLQGHDKLEKNKQTKKKPTVFINDWETGKNICSCKCILGNNNFTVHAKKLSIFPSYMLVISFFNYCNCNCFLVFLPPSQQNQNPEQIICISYYYSSNSYLEILSWLLSQAYGSNLSL